jgi:lipoprotein-releasing system permease protein
VSGVELFLSDIQTLDATYENVIDVLPYDLSAMKVTEQHLQIFEWLEMIGRNVEVLLVLITLVACFSMVSSLLIMILERTRMIGTLKALGASDGQIRNIFLWSGLRLTLRGMFWGNAVGLGFCALQYQFHLIPLDPENYYMYYVPIAWNYWAFIWLNVLTLLLTAIVLLLPTRIIAGIKPIKAIKFD